MLGCARTPAPGWQRTARERRGHPLDIAQLLAFASWAPMCECEVRACLHLGGGGNGAAWGRLDSPIPSHWEGRDGCSPRARSGAFGPRLAALRFCFIIFPTGWEGWGGQGQSGQ